MSAIKDNYEIFFHKTSPIGNIIIRNTKTYQVMVIFDSFCVSSDTSYIDLTDITAEVLSFIVSDSSNETSISYDVNLCSGKTSDGFNLFIYESFSKYLSAINNQLFFPMLEEILDVDFGEKILFDKNFDGTSFTSKHSDFIFEYMDYKCELKVLLMSNGKNIWELEVPNGNDVIDIHKVSSLNTYIISYTDSECPNTIYYSVLGIDFLDRVKSISKVLSQCHHTQLVNIFK